MPLQRHLGRLRAFGWPRALLPGLTLLQLLPAPARAQEPAGSEFRISSYTTSAGQLASAVASDANGDFVVVWQGYFQDGSGSGVFGRRFDWSGAPRGPEFRANAYTTGNQRHPAVAVDGKGSFIVVWESEGQDGSGDGVFAQRFDASGNPQGAEFRVNSFTTGAQRLSHVAADPGGGFVVVWQSDGQDGSSYGIFARRFDASGGPLGTEFQVNSATPGFQARPSVAADQSGNLIVVWTNDFDSISGQRFDGSGARLGGEFQVNSVTAFSQSYSVVATTPGGGFVVAWQASPLDGDQYGVFARRFDSSGTPQGADFRVNTYTTGFQSFPSVAADEAGNFVVAWESFPQDYGNMGVFAQRYDASGAPRGGEVRVNTYTTSWQRYPAVAADPDGDFVVTWSGYGLGGYNVSVFGQRYGDLIFQDNFESGGVSRWSSAAANGTDLTVSAAAALAGTALGLQATSHDRLPSFVQDDTPDDESRYRARFYFDPNGFDPGEAAGHFRLRVFVALDGAHQRLFSLVLRRLGGVYGLRGRVRLDDGSRADTPFSVIGDGPHFLEVDWRRASGLGTSDGSFTLRLDGAVSSELTGLDNASSGVGSVRLGALSVKSGASGTLFFDQFESRRQRLIGPE